MVSKAILRSSVLKMDSEHQQNDVSAMHDMLNMEQNMGDFQKSYYDVVDKDDVLLFKHEQSRHKVCWNSPIISKLEQSLISGQHSYTINKFYHFLKKVFIIAHIPKIELKEEYKKNTRFCYTNNLLHHVHGPATFNIDKSTCLSLNPIVLDFQRESRIKDVNNYDEDIGNIEEYLDFSTSKPARKLTMYPGWSFNNDDKIYIPLFFKYADNVTIRHSFELNLCNMMVMQELVETKEGQNEWKTLLKPDPARFTKAPTIPVPELWGVYDQVSSREIKENEKEDIVLEVEDYIIKRDNSTKKMNSTISLTIDKDLLVRSMCWMARNENAHNRGLLSNYSTEIDLKKGRNPAVTSSVLYANSPRVSPRSSIHFDKIYPKMYYGRKPKDPGYNMYSNDTTPLNNRRYSNLVAAKHSQISPITVEMELGTETTPEVDHKFIDNLETEEIDDKHKARFRGFLVTSYVKRFFYSNKNARFYQVSNDVLYQNVR